MAASAQSRRKKTSSSQSKGRGGNNKKTTAARKNAAQRAQEEALKNEILIIVVFALTVLLFLCNFGVIGVVGDAISSVMFGVFGICAYAVPILLFIGIAFGISNRGNRIAHMKLIAGIVFFILIGIAAELVSGTQTLFEAYSVQTLYKISSLNRIGGGVIAGSLAWLCHHFLGMVGTVLLVLVLGIISMVIITEKSFVRGVRSSGQHVYETAKAEAQNYRERSKQRREEYLLSRQEEEEEEEAEESFPVPRKKARSRREENQLRRQERERQREEEKERRQDEQILRMNKKVSGVMADTSLKDKEKSGGMRDDIHEITLKESMEGFVEVHNVVSITDRTIAEDADREENEESKKEEELSFDHIRIHSMHQETLDEMEGFVPEEKTEAEAEADIYDEAEEEEETADVFRDMKEVRPVSLSSSRFQESSADIEEEKPVRAGRPKAVPAPKPETQAGATQVGQQLLKQEKERAKAVEKPYHFPPISLLHKSERKGSGDGARELKETARHLQETLETFGVHVTITDISQGPAVTRYELQPEQGVKVSKIVSLTDDIKLNLAATDIRIEAPIPGKAAIGIEVPNKENVAVGLRELLETKEFKDFKSNLTFAVGKDIAGKVVVSDIAKMPHMLIAGSTGSGKSVCINTIIMSILYKANPKDVKLIMVDPKVVELSVYNGIPHLMIPVVTDPKKAAAALQWAVAEMSDRYQKFAEHNVRDLKGYNKKIEQMQASTQEDAPEKMPQIVIIVDELADLMMVSPGEVEESICRLAQLARACGIHLIIATQRPSVDVITGLIKANMPSRVAFAVKSGVDSRTILDMNGAEKLLGKGDMLFYPSGYPKPVRVQGAFVSDDEVSDVVDFLKNQNIGNVYNTDVEEKLKNFSAASASDSGSESAPEYDSYFVEAGQFIIDKDKASIGMLQRVFRIGFNRAARIMDQLAQTGVVGEEEGTKPRKILMTMEEFNQLVEEII